MVNLHIRDLAFLSTSAVATATTATDDFEAYTVELDLGGLNAGTNWLLAYISRSDIVDALHSFENLADGTNLEGATGGSGWMDVYISNETVSSLDDFESYTDGADLGGLNDGTNWAAAYISH